MGKMKEHFERIRQWEVERERDEQRDAEYWENLYLSGRHPEQKKKENQPPQRAQSKVK